MFGIGGFELFIIVVFAFIIFGQKRFPEIIKIAGLAIKKLRNAKAELDKVVQEEIVDPVMEVANQPDPPKTQDLKTDKFDSVEKPKEIKLESSKETE